METVYIESSIVSYLRRKPSTQVVAAARQLITEKWWTNERLKYDLVASQYVIDEVSAGDTALSADRLAALDGIPVLPNAPQIQEIANEIISKAILPSKAASRCASHCRRCPSPHTISVDLELQTHRECQDSSANSRRSVNVRNTDSNHLHSRGVDGR
jgi:hypothetical protein